MGDLVVGAFSADPNGSQSGSSYVVFGKTTPFSASLQLASLNGTDGFRLDGAAVNDQSGRSVAAAGDINGDGLDDLVVGAFAADPNGSQSGSSYVLFGKTTAF
ncbi:MAG: integrin alpha, partial [Lysobacterales bacterium]